jgi:hypothetical protein
MINQRHSNAWNYNELLRRKRAEYQNTGTDSAASDGEFDPGKIKPQRLKPNLGGFQLVFIGLPFVISISSLPGLRK